MSSSLRKYLLVEHVVPATIINFLLNALIAWLSFRHLNLVPMWGQQSIGGDLIGTTIILPLLTCLIVTQIVRSHLRHGRLSPADLGEEPRSLLERLPVGTLKRGLVLGVITTIVAAPVLLMVLHLAGVDSLALKTFLWFKASYAGVLGALVQPVVAMRAILDGRAA